MTVRYAWKLMPAEPNRADALARACGIEPLTAQLLLNRGIEDPTEAEGFFHPALDRLADPLSLTGMSQAVAAIRAAVASQRLTLVFGDSDVDGISAATLVAEAITQFGGRVVVRLSNRLEDGYGFPPAGVTRAARAGIGLVILVDCGTNQPKEFEALARHGISTVVLDHHVPGDQAARPTALVNPHLGGGGKGLCSTGLAVKLMQALLPEDPRALQRCLDLAAVGTLADYVPLRGDNRILVAEGLASLSQSGRIGLRHLCDAVGMTTSSTEQVLKRLVPRLNAAGRLGNARAVWRLLAASSSTAIPRSAKFLEDAHATTKALYRHAMAEASEQVSRFHFRDHHVLVVGRRGWHAGLMGPLASALTEQYARPVIALALNDRVGVGSGRAPDAFNLFEALRACERMLLKYGGHSQACGLTLASEQFEAFRDQINQYAHAQPRGDHGHKVLRIDAHTTIGALQRDTVARMEAMKPFGQGNPKPTVLLRRVKICAEADGSSLVDDGAARLKVRGKVPPCDGQGRYDVVATPTLAHDEPVASLIDVRETTEER